MRTLFACLLCFGLASGAFGKEPAAASSPNVALYFGIPFGLFPGTALYEDSYIRAKRRYFVVHPLNLRLDDEEGRGPASSDGVEDLSAPIYEVSYYRVWNESEAMAEDN